MSIEALKSFLKFLTDIEIVPVVFAIGISIVWPDFLLAALFVAAFFWLIRRVALGYFSIRTPADWGIIILVIMVPFTLWATALPDITQLQVLRLLSGIALFYAIVNWCESKSRLRLVLPAFTLMGLGLGLIALVSVQWAIDKLSFAPAGIYQAIPALFSDTVHPNVLAGSLVIFIPIVLAELLFAWSGLSKFEKILNLLALSLMLGVLGLTLSRGAWIAMAAVLVVMPILRWRWGWIALVVALAMALVSVKWMGLTSILQLLASSGTIGGLDGRMEIWSRSIFIIRDFPFTGIGMGTFGHVVDALYPLFYFPPGSVPHAHNLFLQIAIDLGIPGLVGWMFVFISAVVVSWKLYKFGHINHDKLAFGLGAGFLCSQLALAVHGLTDAATWGMVRPAVFVWAIWGLVMAGWMVLTQERKSERQTTLI